MQMQMYYCGRIRSVGITLENLHRCSVHGTDITKYIAASPNQTFLYLWIFTTLLSHSRDIRVIANAIASRFLLYYECPIPRVEFYSSTKLPSLEPLILVHAVMLNHILSTNDPLGPKYHNEVLAILPSIIFLTPTEATLRKNNLKKCKLDYALNIALHSVVDHMVQSE